MKKAKLTRTLRKGGIIAIGCLAIVSCNNKPTDKNTASRDIVSIVPKPVKIEMGNKVFHLSSNNGFKFDSKNQALETLAEYNDKLIQELCGIDLKDHGNGIQLILLNKQNPKIGDEGYILKVADQGISISANNEKGLFYGVQTLRQLIPIQKESEVDIPYMTIVDYPRLAWRGLHLDVGRHFFPKEDVERFIDLMSMYKINKFHWHLTEDQGWRIEIKKYPNLTKVGAWRSHVSFPANQKLGLDTDDGKQYGGFYSQDDVREIVKYASARGVDIIPEIEMPGHSQAAIASYPELYCFNEKIDVWTGQGVSDGVYCAGKESTFEFMQNVLLEVMDLFPSKYIHIGGDEAPKRNWQKCPLCQKRIKEEGLKDEHELQSYFIRRIETFLNKHDRKLVGWDEIMEGGVSPTATVMSWRGMTPGIEAAEKGNKVIMTPGDPTYFNRPQSVNPVTQCKGAVTPLRKVYEWDPVPENLNSSAQQNIIGVHACQWSEGTPNRRVLEYKEYPRAIALAEIGWTPKDARSWSDFDKRLRENTKYLDFYNVGYGQRSYDTTIKVIPDSAHKHLFVEFAKEVESDIYYTLDGSEPSKDSQKYNGKFEIVKSSEIKARIYRPDGTAARVASQKINFHKAIGKVVTYNIPYSSKHSGGGDYAMTNGMLNMWQGFEKRDVDLVVDLGEEMPINSIETNWKYDVKDWVFKPKEVIYAISSDGNHYKSVFTKKNMIPEGKYEKGAIKLEAKIKNKKARYIRLKAKSIKTNPKWHGSAGAANWVFVDEIIVK